jgi:hypothetical protein
MNDENKFQYNTGYYIVYEFKPVPPCQAMRHSVCPGQRDKYLYLQLVHYSQVLIFKITPIGISGCNRQMRRYLLYRIKTLENEAKEMILQVNQAHRNVENRR